MKDESRRERERQQHRRYILDTAERLFAREGFINVSMRQISQGAEFALGTLYRFFKGKQEIYNQLLEEKIQQLVSFVLERMAAVPEPLEKVRKFIEAKLEFFHCNLDFLRLYFAETHDCRSQGEVRRSEFLHEGREGLLGALTQVFEQGIAAGIFRGTRPRDLATALDGLTSAFAWSWIDRKPRRSPTEEISAAERLFLGGALVHI